MFDQTTIAEMNKGREEKKPYYGKRLKMILKEKKQEKYPTNIFPYCFFSFRSNKRRESDIICLQHNYRLFELLSFLEIALFRTEYSVTRNNIKP